VTIWILERLELPMTKNEPTDPIEQAWQQIDSGDLREAYRLLMPLLAEGDPAAQFLYSSFSFANEESTDEFEARSVRLLRMASDAGYPPAMYALAVRYDIGDAMVIRDVAKADALFKAAADAGHPRAKLIHGTALFYGANDVEQDEAKGLLLIEQAAADGVDDAQDALEAARERLSRNQTQDHQ